MHAVSLGHLDASFMVRVRAGAEVRSVPSARFSVTPIIMKKSIKVTPKKRRGRPATGRDPHVTSRMPPELIFEVEAWSAANETTRSEAIRRLVELGLTLGKPTQTTAATADRAKQLASQAIDGLTTGGTNDDEKA